MGYELFERDTPVALEDIRGEFLRSRIESNGCCGEKELIKLEAYTFTQYPIVVHVAVVALILKPLDPLFDVMIGNRKVRADNQLPNVEKMRWPEMPVPSKINAFFTRDCKFYFCICTNQIRFICMLILLLLYQKTPWSTGIFSEKLFKGGCLS